MDESLDAALLPPGVRDAMKVGPVKVVWMKDGESIGGDVPFPWTCELDQATAIWVFKGTHKGREIRFDVPVADFLEVRPLFTPPDLQLQHPGLRRK